MHAALVNQQDHDNEHHLHDCDLHQAKCRIYFADTGMNRTKFRKNRHLSQTLSSVLLYPILLRVPSIPSPQLSSSKVNLYLVTGSRTGP